MKKLLLLASGSLLCFVGCYKETIHDKPFDVLVSTSWTIINHTKDTIGDGTVDCRIPQEVVFNKDSTGYYYYPSKCKPGDADTLHFNWKLSGDSRNIYYTNVVGEPKWSGNVNIKYFTYDGLILYEGRYPGRRIDGFFEPKAK